MILIYKILRITAWILVAVTIFTLFSGFLTTKYFLTPWLGYSASYFIHTIIIPLIFLPFFYIHSTTGILALISRHENVNKKSIKIIAGAIWTSIFILFIFLYAAQNPALSAPANNSTVGQNTSGLNGTANVTLNFQEITKHNSANDCWLLISNKVYNVTSYLGAHPGGAGAILPHCGKDATTAFTTKDIGRPHSSAAASLLSSYYIGDLNQTIDQQQVQQNVQSTNSVTPPSGGEYEDD